MRVLASPPARILVAEHDRHLRAILLTMLRLEGYEADEAESLEQALAKVETHLYHCILTDLFVPSLPPRLDAVKRLQQRCQPTPVGILSGWRLDQAEVQRAGFAFALEKPFEMELLLRRIAECLNQPLTPEEEQQAQVLWRYLQALSQSDWGALRTLCTEQVRYYPLTESAFTPARAITGIEAYLAYVQLVRSRLPDVRLEEVVVFRHPTRNGLIARYVNAFTGPDGQHHRLSGSLLCRFRDQRLSRIGFAQNTHWLRAVVTPTA